MSRAGARAAAFGGLRSGMPRVNRLAGAAILFLCFGFALNAISPSLEMLEASALVPRETSQNFQAFGLAHANEQGPHALYIPSAGGVAEFEIGSRDLAVPGSQSSSGFGFASQAYLLSLPPSAGSAETTLRVRFNEDHGRIGTSRVFLTATAGAAEAANAQTDWAWGIQVASMTVSLLSAFFFMTLIGSVSPCFAPGALAALAYLVLAQALAREHEVGAFFGQLLDGAEYLLAVWVAFALSVVLKHKEEKARRLGRVPLVLLILSSAAVFIAQPDFTPLLLWVPAALAAPLIAIGVMRSWQAAADSALSSVSFATMLGALAAAAFGLMRAADPSLFNEAFALVTLHGLGPLPLLTVGAVTLSTHSFAARREVIAKLRADYAAQSAELGRVGAILQEEARRRMLFEERSRITRDMHDGIGGRLLSLLIRVRAGRLDIAEVEREIQESLNDLRLIVDSLDSAGDSLGAALDAFRARAERQLAGAGMTLAWREEADALDGISLDPQAMLNLFRILQESVANAIRHAGAQTVSISFARDDAGRLAIAVGDDGCGLPADAGTGRGKGLKNMKARAERFGADLQITSNGGTGCRVSITLPGASAIHSASGSSSQPI